MLNPIFQNFKEEESVHPTNLLYKDVTSSNLTSVLKITKSFSVLTEPAAIILIEVT